MYHATPRLALTPGGVLSKTDGTLTSSPAVAASTRVGGLSASSGAPNGTLPTKTNLHLPSSRRDVRVGNFGHPSQVGHASIGPELVSSNLSVGVGVSVGVGLVCLAVLEERAASAACANDDDTALPAAEPTSAFVCLVASPSHPGRRSAWWL